MAQEQNNNMNRLRMPGMRGPRNRMAAEKPQDAKKTLKKIFPYFTKEMKIIAVLLLVVMVMVLCSVALPSMQSNAIDAITARQFDLLPKILFMMAVVYLLNSLSNFCQARLSARLSQNIVKRMRTDLFRQVVNLPIQYIDTHPGGDIMSRMSNDIENISNTVAQSLGSMFSGVLTIIGTVAIMIYYCPQLALLSCTTVILTILATKYLSRAMRTFYTRRQALLGSLNATAEEMITGYKTITAYNRQDAVVKEFCETSDELKKVGIVAEILGGSMGPVMNVINNIGFVIIAAFGGYFALHGVISIGVISAFIVYAKQFGRPIDELAQIYGQIQTAIASAERVFALLEENQEDKSGAVTEIAPQGNIIFDHVNFSYVEGKRILSDFQLEVAAGQKIALVGATGSGKTTVVNLLMRFYPLDSGAIRIDGTDICDMDCNALRKNIAIVLQDTILFSDTIENNLRYANADATQEELDEATKQSNCYTTIQHMKDGYQTLLSEGGQNISQGQRQLLSIARAFLAKPKILILDEATSSVDTRTEKHIQDAMVNLMKNRTSLIIAHRLSTIRDADVIVVLDNGKIAEQGTHEELLARKGAYYELYMTQYAGVET